MSSSPVSTPEPAAAPVFRPNGLVEVLKAARGASTHTTDLGDRFERLAAAALIAHPGPNGSDRFARVWLWKDWPGRDSHDIGIDLVAEQTPQAGGGLVAIQCKFYQGQVSTKAVDSFLAASGRPEFKARILMTTGSGVQEVGAQKMRVAYPPCEIIDLAEMRRWKINWWQLAHAHHVVAPGAKPPPPSRPTQIFAAYIASLKQRWRTPETGMTWQRWLLRVYLAVEAAVVVALLLAVIAVTAIGIVLITILLVSGSTKRRRRR